MFWIYAIIALNCFWFYALLILIDNMRYVARVEKLAVPQREEWPRLSVIIPACNEGDALEAALRSRLRETYPNLEFILVNDRSTDNTGDIADRLAREDARLNVVHVHTLPEGWLGKVHALQRGIEQASGEWILLMDADIHMEPGTLERIVGWCENRHLDHVTLLPSMKSNGFALGMAYAYFLRLAATASLARLVEHPKVKLAAGSGVFSLFRRSALERTPGMARLRLEVIDDIGLGFLLKAYGARSSMINGASHVSLHWYPTLRAMMKGFEKNGFAIVNYNVAILLLACAFFISIEWAPYCSLLFINHPLMQMMGVIAILIQAGVTVSVSKWLKMPLFPALGGPIATLILSFFLFRSGVMTLWRGEIVWRGTRYSLNQLRNFRKLNHRKSGT